MCKPYCDEGSHDRCADDERPFARGRKLAEELTLSHMLREGREQRERAIGTVPRSTRDTWVTREGVRIPIRELEDRHLDNIVAFLRRHARSTMESLIRKARSFLPTIDDWNACDTSAGLAFLTGMETLVGELESITEDEFLAATVEAWPALLEEQQRRGMVGLS